MIKAVIFDMDGLMTDNEPLQYECIFRTLHDYGVSLSKDEFKDFIGITQQETFRLAKSRYQIDASVDDLIKNKKEYYLQIISEKLQPKPGLYDLVAFVNRCKLKKAIASSSPLYEIKAVLKKIKLLNEFKTIQSSFGTTRGKPYPDIYLKAADRLNVNPIQCIVLEDSERGVKSAKSAGMKCIAIPNSTTSYQNFSMSDKIVEDLFKAKEILESWI